MATHGGPETFRTAGDRLILVEETAHKHGVESLAYQTAVQDFLDASCLLDEDERAELPGIAGSSIGTFIFPALSSKNDKVVGLTLALLAESLGYRTVVAHVDMCRNMMCHLHDVLAELCRRRGQTSPKPAQADPRVCWEGERGSTPAFDTAMPQMLDQLAILLDALTNDRGVQRSAREGAKQLLSLRTARLLQQIMGEQPAPDASQHAANQMDELQIAASRAWTSYYKLLSALMAAGGPYRMQESVTWQSHQIVEQDFKSLLSGNACRTLLRLCRTASNQAQQHTVLSALEFFCGRSPFVEPPDAPLRQFVELGGGAIIRKALVTRLPRGDHKVPPLEDLRYLVLEIAKVEAEVALKAREAARRIARQNPAPTPEGEHVAGCSHSAAMPPGATAPQIVDIPDSRRTLDFHMLSVSKLKEYLRERGISSAGCIEKSDLVAKCVSATQARVQAGTAQAAGHWYTTQLRSSDEAQRSLVEGMLLDDAALDRLMASLLREPAGTRMRRKLLCALESPKLHRTDWVLRWEAGQGSGAKDVFDVLGGQLWGSRLSECSVMSPPYCDAVLIVVKAFGTAKEARRCASGCGLHVTYAMNRLGDADCPSAPPTALTFEERGAAAGPVAALMCHCAWQAAVEYVREEEKAASRGRDPNSTSPNEAMTVDADLEQGIALLSSSASCMSGEGNASSTRVTRCAYKRFAVKIIFAFDWTEILASGFTQNSFEGSMAMAAFLQRVLQAQLRLLNERAPAGHTCAACGVAEASAADGSEGAAHTKVCAGCRLVRFCGAACQKAAWKEHKAVCRAGGLGEQPQLSAAETAAMPANVVWQ